VRTKGALSAKTAKLMVFKLVDAAAKTWRRLKGENQLPKVIAGIKFQNGIEESKCRLTTPPNQPRHPISGMAHDILVNIPARPLGRLNAALIPVASGDLTDRIHISSPFPKWFSDRQSADDQKVGRRPRSYDWPTGMHDHNAVS
jgi:hypothetical protein